MSLSRSDDGVPVRAHDTNRDRWALEAVRRHVGTAPLALPVSAVERTLFDRYFAPAHDLGSGRDGTVSLYRWRGALQQASHVALLDTPAAGDAADQGAVVSDDAATRQDGVAVKSVQDRGKFDREAYMHAVATLAAVRDRFAGLVPLLAIVVERSSDAMVPRLMIMPVMRETLEDELDRAAAQWPSAARLKLHRRRWAQGDAVLEWLHGVARMVHGDAHPGNWFLYHDDKPSRLLLGDFGEARTADELGADDFATACTLERTEFAFAMAPTGRDKRKLGAALGAIEARAAK